MRISRIELDKVVVPARPDSVNSPETDYALHKLASAGRQAWTIQFDRLPKIVIRIHLENGVVGLGETYRDPPEHAIRTIAQGLVGLDLNGVNFQQLPIARGRWYDGFECAIADAYARASNLPLCTWLGGRWRDRVKCGFWTGHRTIADAARKALEALEAGYDSIKFKCTLSDPVADWCAAIRDACGPGMRIILDPNERFGNMAAAARILRDLETIGNLLCIEDPLPRWDLENFALLKDRGRIPIAVHVSLPYLELGQKPEDAVLALRARACDYFNFNGGIWACKQLFALADLHGIPYWHGSELDLGILEAAYIHKSASGQFAQLPADIFGRLVREHDLLTRPIAIEDGFANIPDGPGLGIELDLDALRQYRISSWTTAL